MYTLIKTIARSYDRTLGVREVDAGALPIRDLIKDNSEIYLVLNNSHLSGLHTLPLELMHASIYKSAPSLTVNAWLASVGNTTLPTTPGDRVLVDKHAVVNDARAAGFTVRNSSGNHNADTGGLIDNDLPHLSLRKLETDYLDMRSKVLASVGGYLHLVDGDIGAYYVLDGATTQRITKSPKVSLISLSNVSKFKCIPLNQCTLTPTRSLRLEDGVTITSSESFTGKTIWLSIGGHLLYLNQSFIASAEKSIYLNWKSLNIHLKYLTAKKHIDLSSVDAAMAVQNGETNVVNKLLLNSNSAIEAYLNLSQSFIIVLDNPSLTTVLTKLEDTGLPGKYLMYDNPFKLIVGQDGRMPSVSIINEHKAWVVSTSIDAGQAANYYGESSNPTDSDLYTNHLMNPKPHKRNTLYSLDIRSTLISAAV